MSPDQSVAHAVSPAVISAGTVAIGQERSISYLEAGMGEPVVLLHGVGSAAQSWRHQLAATPSGYRFVAWDAPGYGNSTALDNAAPQPSDYALSLDGFADALGLSCFHLVGHSLGALIAACYARKHADRLRSLTLASIAPGQAWMSEADRARLRDGRLETLAKLGVRGMAETRGPGLLSPAATDDMRRAVVETMAAIRPDGWRQAVMMLSQADTRADLAEVPDGLPVQIVFGDRDTVTPPDSNRRTATARPAAPIHVIAGAGHAVYIERPEEFNRVLLTFLDAHRLKRSIA